jgi:hypothetical protein
VLEEAPFGFGLGEFERALVGVPGLGVAAGTPEQVGAGGVVVAVVVEVAPVALRRALVTGRCWPAPRDGLAVAERVSVAKRGAGVA